MTSKNFGKTISQRKILLKKFGSLFLAFQILAACVSIQVQPPPAIEDKKPQALLSWEINNPERATWTKAIVEFIERDFAAFDSAKDFDQIRADYKSLSHEGKVTAWAEFFCQIAKYESNWNPKDASVDVGTKDNKNTWSVGLLQLSVVDQANRGIKLGLTYDDLLTPIKNLELGAKIMVSQIKSKGLVLIPVGQSGVYWSTIHPGGKYDKTKLIAAAVQSRKLK